MTIFNKSQIHGNPTRVTKPTHKHLATQNKNANTWQSPGKIQRRNRNFGPPRRTTKQLSTRRTKFYEVKED